MSQDNRGKLLFESFAASGESITKSLDRGWPSRAQRRPVAETQAGFRPMK
jgi:hypothetical protein